MNKLLKSRLKFDIEKNKKYKIKNLKNNAINIFKIVKS